MDFDFSEEQEALREAVRRWVAKDYTFEHRRAVVRAGGHAKSDWQALAGLGLSALCIPESQGGLGQGPVEAMVVMEELGRGLVLEPLAELALVAPALLQAGTAELQAAWLPRIASGEAKVVLAQQERAARYQLNRVDSRAQHSAEGWRLSGRKSLVPVGDQVEAFIVPARISGAADSSDGIGLFLLERQGSGVNTRGHLLQDGSRAAELSFENSPATLITQDGALEWLERARDIGIAALCAEAVGAMEALTALTADYLKTRKQFGVAIASFQALRHRMADVKMQLELARAMSYYATLKLSEPPAQRRRALSQAKWQLGQSLRFVGQQCVQLHGGIGVTDEYIASHFFKRLTVMELQYGDSLHHLGEVSSRMQDSAGVFA